MEEAFCPVSARPTPTASISMLRFMSLMKARSPARCSHQSVVGYERMPIPSRREFLKLAAVPAFAQAGSRPNVIVILTDDQGYGDFSCHGNPILKTPNTDAIHSES